MHYFIFAEKDTYITNEPKFLDKNFGLNEVLKVGTENKLIKQKFSTKKYYYNLSIFNDRCVDNFNGTVTGSLYAGTSSFLNGYVNNGTAVITSSYFSGSINFNAPVEINNAEISGSISGLLSGSADIFQLQNFTGSVQFYSGKINGIVSGYDERKETYWDFFYKKNISRILLKFNLSWLSQSISSGRIKNPKVFLKLKTCEEYQLPLKYSLYAFPLSQSWEMGDGYFSDDGSDFGCSWKYSDYKGGTLWYPFTSSLYYPVVDYIFTQSNSNFAFERGGGTWYYSSGSVSLRGSQDFNYESSDVNMDVTDIAMSWISGSIPNHGFILLSSDEIQENGNGFYLKFYSKDTNTIYSPKLDVAWDDSEWTFSTQLIDLVNIKTKSPGIYASISQNSFTASLPTSHVGDLNGYLYIFDYSSHFVNYSGSISEFIEQFTGSISSLVTGSLVDVSGYVSGSSVFVSDYFSGSIDFVDYETNNLYVSSSNVNGYISGSVSFYSNSYFNGLGTGSFYCDGNINGLFLDKKYESCFGILAATGSSGFILNKYIEGNIIGLVSKNLIEVTSSCGDQNNNLVDKFYSFSGTISNSYYSGMLVSGKTTDKVTFSGSVYGNYLYNGNFSNLSIFIPSQSIAKINLNDGINNLDIIGKNINNLISGSFEGSVFGGDFHGCKVNFNYTINEIVTSSYLYTESVFVTTKFFETLDTNKQFVVYLKNLKPCYKFGDICKINVFARDNFPTKVHEKSSQLSSYVVPKILPTSSYYCIKDNFSEEVIVGFDEFTKLSCEYPGGNYFMLDTTVLPQEREFRILIRVEDGRSTYTFDNLGVFKVTR